MKRTCLALCLALIGQASAQLVQTSTAVTEPPVNPVIEESSAPDGVRFGVVGGYLQTTFADDTTTSGLAFGVEVEMPVNESSTIGADVTGIWRSGPLASDERNLAFGSAGLNYRYYLAPEHQGFYVGGRAAYQTGGFAAQGLLGYATPVARGFYAGAELRGGVMVGSWKPAYGGLVRLGYGF